MMHPLACKELHAKQNDHLETTSNVENPAYLLSLIKIYFNTKITKRISHSNKADGLKIAFHILSFACTSLKFL